MDREDLERQISALDEGRGVLPLDGFRLVEATGTDAGGWLQDLVTADVLTLEPGSAVRSLLLGPTGRIRADLHVLRRAEGRLLVQALDQPADVGVLLAPYVLSSDVRLEQVPAGDLVAIPGSPAWRFAQAGPDGSVAVGMPAIESWRIRRGLPRFPVDLDGDSLPAEAGLDDEVTIDRTKGCYLGQETVAKVRNLGHPTRVVLALEADGTVEAGTPVLAEGDEVGLVTSADTLGGASALLARVRWQARGAALRTPSGTPLRGR